MTDPFPYPPDEEDRLAALRALQILDSPPEERFDRITRLAQRIFDVPVALITFVDAQRQWFKSRIGLEWTVAPRSIGFCPTAILEPEPLVVSDAFDDPRFAEDPFVLGPPGWRFYAGHPLMAPDGHRVGTLSIADQQPRMFGPTDRATLRDLAALVEKELSELLLLETAIERQHAVEALAAAELHLRAVLDLLPTAIAALDVTVDGEGTLELVNQRFVSLTGYTADELPTLDEWYRLVYPDLITRLRAQMQTTALLRQALTTNVDVPPFERTITRRDGQERTVEIKVSFIGNTMLALLNDLTEQRAVERELATARDQALEASRLKSEFLATMSHEIRTPMNGVIGMTEILLETDLSAEQRELTSVIQGEAESLLKIINDILDFSKIEAGKLVLDEIDFDPRAVVEGVVTSHASVADARGVTLTGFVAPDVPGRLRGDPIRLRQILTNLVGNAVKFTEDGAVIVQMSVDRTAVSRWAVRCFVTDSGIGIAEDALAHLFEPFTQADGSTTRKYGGTGLGLAICRRLAELMGGEIGVTSETGVGSTFWFTARFARPLQQSAMVPPDLLTLEAEPRARAEPWLVDTPDDAPLVLVVDDNANNRITATHQLTRLGYRVATATNGQEAVDALSQEHHPYALVLLDCQMPELDGFATTHTIRAGERSSGRHLPIVAMTANAMRGDRERCLEAGMDDYLSKPVRLEPLRQILERWAPRPSRTEPAVTMTEE